MWKMNPLLKMSESTIIKMPIPVNISWWWNFGSLLGLCLILQILSGLFLAMHYSNFMIFSFPSVVHISQDVNTGWLFRSTHANGASLFFVCIYLHIFRGLYFSSFSLVHTWLTGTSILFILMATAFLGYVLPWGQMSLWGATVITNLLSSIPYIGNILVLWLWGGTSVNAPTLSRFFTFHFMLPFLLLALMLMHIMFLHSTGSNNPLGIKSNFSKTLFHPFHSIKDILGIFIALSILIMISLKTPFILGDPENFNPANSMSSPIHIKPEWYYLFAYAILRAIPNKLGGVVALVMSILILYLLPFMNNKKFNSSTFYPLNKLTTITFGVITILLTWIGGQGVEDPYIFLGQLLTASYFSFFFTNPFIFMWWELKLSEPLKL